MIKRLKAWYQDRLELKKILREGWRRYPHPQDDVRRARYVAERYFAVRVTRQAPEVFEKMKRARVGP